MHDFDVEEIREIFSEYEFDPARDRRDIERRIWKYLQIHIRYNPHELAFYDKMKHLAWEFDRGGSIGAISREITYLARSLVGYEHDHAWVESLLWMLFGVLYMDEVNHKNRSSEVGT